LPIFIHSFTTCPEGYYSTGNFQLFATTPAPPVNLSCKQYVQSKS